MVEANEVGDEAEPSPTGTGHWHCGRADSEVVVLLLHEAT